MVSLQASISTIYIFTRITDICSSFVSFYAEAHKPSTIETLFTRVYLKIQYSVFIPFDLGIDTRSIKQLPGGDDGCPYRYATGLG